MSSSIGRKDIPNAKAPNFSEKVRESVQVYLGHRGDPLDRGVTVRDLVNSKIAKLNDQASTGAITGTDTGSTSPVAPGGDVYMPAYVVDLTPPPAPTGLTVTGGLSNLFIETDDPVFGAGHGYARTLIYGVGVANAGTPPTYTEGVTPLLTEFVGSVGIYPTEPSMTWYVWAKWRSIDGVDSSVAGGTNGVSATTGQDVNNLLDALSEAAKSNSTLNKFAVRADMFYVTAAGNNGAINPMFTVTTIPITSNGVTAPAGVYMRAAYIANGTITNAMIGNAMIDNAKIANVSAAKLTAGSINVGEYIQSAGYIAPGSNPSLPLGTGWRIDGDGTAHFNANVTITGTVNATAGTVGGTVIGTNFIRSTDYVLASAGWKINSAGSIEINTIHARGNIMGGSFQGNVWPAAPGTGFYLGPEGLKIGNLNTGRYVQIDATGDMITPQFSIINGNATFSGTLSAASGTFTGLVKAGSLSVGDSADGMVFFDSAQAGVALRSSAQGWYNTSVGATSAPITSSNVQFTTNTTATPISRRVRTGTVRFTITATATVDHYFSLWYRTIQGSGAIGAWVALAQSVEPQASYGTVACAAATELTLSLGQSVQFGMAATDMGGVFLNSSATAITDGNLVVTAVNF